MTIDDIPEDLIVTVNCIRKAGFCVSGQRRWFTAYGFDFRTILAEGINARELFATGDAYAIQVIESVIHG